MTARLVPDRPATNAARNVGLMILLEERLSTPNTDSQLMTTTHVLRATNGAQTWGLKKSTYADIEEQRLVNAHVARATNGSATWSMREAQLTTTTHILRATNAALNVRHWIWKEVTVMMTMKRENREDSDEGRKRSVDRGRKQKRRHSASHSTSRRRDTSKRATKSSGRHHRDSSSSTDRHVSRRKHRQRVKVDKYDGSTCVEVFLTEFKYIADYNDWDDEDRLAHLKAALTGSAKYLVTESEGLTYEDMKEKLRRRYSTRE